MSRAAISRAIHLLICVLVLAGTRSALANKPQGPEDALPVGALRDAPSLYLREAASSPVRWQPWGDQTFALAKRLKRPMLIDIGAVWCHWCHVMDQATYTDPEVVKLINRYFVPVKVDSDQRPDIDSYYQDLAQREFGIGGWPLTCFTDTQGALRFAAGYMPPRELGQHPTTYGMVFTLKSMAKGWKEDRAGFERLASSRVLSFRRWTPPASQNTAEKLRTDLIATLKEQYDVEGGAFVTGGRSRFYYFPAIELMLARGFFGETDSTRDALESLRKMADGGVFDQLGGGFHRYSSDPAWRVPHFEKLLGDQAMALSAYAHAYVVSGDPRIALIARAIISYVNGTLLDPKTHAFYSHQDADAYAGDDGSYYTWTKAEVERALSPQQARAVLLYFGFDDDPALAPDRRVVLRRALEPDQLAQRLGLKREQSDALLADALSQMRRARTGRRTPAVDHGVLVDRNALMASAYLTAAAALRDPNLRKVALDDIDYLLAHARAPNGNFYHSVDDSRAEVPGLVADQTYMLAALIDAYEASGDQRYLDDSRRLAGVLTKNFRDPRSGLLRNHIPPPARMAVLDASPGPDVFYDHPMPAIQPAAARALLALASLTGDQRYSDEARDLMVPAPKLVGASGGPLLGTLGLALEERHAGETLVAIVGAEHDPRTRGLWDEGLRAYRPAKVVMIEHPMRTKPTLLPATARAMIAARTTADGPLALLCAGISCAKPVSSAPELAKLIHEFGLQTANTVRAASPN